jgi:asparagine synthase (glutamine-hydrolysing)
MCGIVGEFRFDGRDPAIPKLRAQLELLSHRGPDARGVWAEGPLGFGHTRLSIIDLSECGNQPMLTPDGSAAMVYNGEVYNYKEIRARLGGGYPFRGRSDTEVVLAALAEKGLSAAVEFEGMFALAFYERRNRRLHLIRDGFGIKPLYYHLNANRLIFSSEIKPLLLDEETPREADLEALRSHLLFGYSPDPVTAFKGIYRLPPGRILSLTADGTASETIYWRIEELFDLPAGDLLETLGESVRLHLRSDVPAGLFLSAGIDSSLLLASASNGGDVVRAFNVGLDQSDEMAGAPSRIERTLARQTSAIFGAEFHPIHPGDSKAPSLHEMALSIEEPIFNPSNALIDLVAAAAQRSGTKVLLSGHGGDEIFAGYRRHVFARYLPYLSVPGVSHGLAAAARFSSSGVLERIARSVTGAAGVDPVTVLTAVGLDMVTKHQVAPGFFGPEHLSSVAAPQADLLSRWKPHSTLKQLMLLDLHTYLPAQNLINMDKASMRRSVEVRVPYLYRPLAAIGLQTPDSQLISGRSNKSGLRRQARKVLPAFLFSAPKMGFGPPAALLVESEEVTELLIGRIAKQRQLFDHEMVGRLLNRARINRDPTLAVQLYGIALIEQWLETFIDAFPVAIRSAAASRSGAIVAEE